MPAVRQLRKARLWLHRDRWRCLAAAAGFRGGRPALRKGKP